MYDLNCNECGPGYCARNFYVTSFPAIIFYDENGNQIYRIGGLYPRDVIFDTLSTYNAMAKDHR